MNTPSDPRGEGKSTPEQFHLAAIAQSIDDAIIGKDLNGIVTAWNRGACLMFGYGAAEMIGHPITRIIPEARLEEEAMILAQIRRGESIAHFHTQRRHSDGRVIDVMLSVCPIRDDAGNVIGVSKIARDMAEEQKMLRALATREALLTAILDTAPDALVVIDERGIIKSFSTAAARMFGYTASEAVGNNISMLMPEPYRSAHDSYLARYLASGVPRIIGIGRIISGQRKDGGVFPIKLQVGEVQSGGERLFAGFVNDLSERFAREQRIADLQSELAHISRVNELGQLVSSLAHELNQPLTAISNYVAGTRRMLDKGALEGVAGALAEMAAQTDRAQQILRRIRNHVTKRGVEKQAEPVLPMLEEAVALSGLRRDHGLTLSVAVQPDVGAVNADKVQIQQVLLNLMRNGAEAMQGMPSRRLRVSAACHGDAVEISVADEGPGLAETVRSRLFQPFVTTKETGMGVGLSLCQSIVEAHGGSLTHRADPHGETIFSFTLPRCDTASL